MKLLLLCLVLSTTAVVPVAARAADEPPLTVCAEDENSYPWLLKDRSGLNMVMMRLMEPHVGRRIVVDLQPWRRCLVSLQEGRVDGAFKASFREDRLKFGLYPMQGAKPDPHRHMLEESYHLYRMKGTPVDWDGARFANASGPVGAQSGFSIIEQLRGQGLEVDDGAKAAEIIFDKLQRGRIVAAALQTNQGDHALASNPALAARIEKVGPPLAVKAYYLMLSRQFVEKNPALAERVWAAVAQVRESGEYKQAVLTFR